MKDKTTIGVAWYKREQWDMLKAISTDGLKLENTYDEWLSEAETTIKNLKKNGIIIQKISIDVCELITWGKTKNIPIDSDARANYVAEKTKNLAAD